VRANVHVIAATNRDLLALVRNGSFREDLYFRLNVIQIEVPPLCQRSEDIPLLVSHYVRQFRGSTGKPIQGFSEEAMARLMAYSFPGNVRELENVVERAFVLCQNDRIGLDHLPASILESNRAVTLATAAPTTMTEAELMAVSAALKRRGGNRTRAAAELGIHRTTLLRLLRRMERGASL
jgi:DNA-binding NtrC family response regulator